MKKTFKEKWEIRNAWNKRTGLYDFMWQVLKKLLIIVAIIVVVVLIGNYILKANNIDLNQYLESYIKNSSTFGVLSLFTISESFLGWIPPDLFILWSFHFEQDFLWMTILGTLSYIGGLAGFGIGKLAYRFPKFQKWLESKNEIFFKRIQKWGGIVILFAALFPLPFSTTTLAAAMVKYPFKLTAIYGLSRYLRFYIYGYLYIWAGNNIL